MKTVRLSLAALVVGWLAALSATPASAQFMFTGNPTLTVEDPFSILGQISPLTAVAAPDGFTLKGDFTLDPDLAAPHITTFKLRVTRPFSVGPFPVAANDFLDSNYKVVVGGGAANDPAVTLLTSLRVDESFFGISIDPLTIGRDVEQIGNGFTIVNALDSADYVLTQGNYELEYTMFGVIENGFHAPTTTITVEMGGLSGFDGVVAEIFAVTVPEPGTFSLLALGGVLFVGVAVRCRRRD